MSQSLRNCVERLAGRTVLVVGDLILDEYITGRATRMSREAPVPVLELESKHYIAGGAANPAANIVSLGSCAMQVGAIGIDDNGRQLIDVLNARGIDVAGILCCDDRPTTVKTRVMARMGLRFPQQVTRIDTVTRDAISENSEEQICEFVRAHIATVDAVLLSHYHGGLLTESLVQRTRELANQHSVLLTADAQGEFARFAGVDVIKCNAADAQRYLNRELVTDDDFREAARQLHHELRASHLTVITRGNRGATIAANEEIRHIPAPKVSGVYDTVGAGDTAIAVMTLALLAGLEAGDAALLANYASGIVVRHLGNYAPSPTELLRSIEDDAL